MILRENFKFILATLIKLIPFLQVYGYISTDQYMWNVEPNNSSIQLTWLRLVEYMIQCSQQFMVSSMM